MTIGQRIMQKRKELGLSQEALGEKVGVSRQAIYKWESDAALPEVEKLIALSKIFSVTVGTLLGVESQEDSSGQQLTPEQLEMAREIASQYRDTPPTFSKKLQKGILWAACILFFVLTVSAIYSSVRIRELQKNYDYLQNSFHEMNQQIDDKIDSIADQVENSMSTTGVWCPVTGAKITDVDYKSNTFTYFLHAYPEFVTQDTTARFIAQIGDQLFTADGIMGESHDFAATITLPLTDEPVSLSVDFMSEGQTENFSIREDSFLYHSSFSQLTINASPLFYSVQKDIMLGSYSISWEPPSPQSVIPQSSFSSESIRLGLFKDGILDHWLTRIDSPVDSPDSEVFEINFLNPSPPPLDRAYQYCLAAVATDEYGRDIIFPDLPICYDETQECWTSVDSDQSEPLSNTEDWKY